MRDKQIEEIKEACLTSYQRGYHEGFSDACKQISGMAKTLDESSKEAFSEWADKQGKEQEHETAQ